MTMLSFRVAVAEAANAQPLGDDEFSLADVADWGPAEDWSDWADATG